MVAAGRRPHFLTVGPQSDAAGREQLAQPGPGQPGQSQLPAVAPEGRITYSCTGLWDDAHVAPFQRATGLMRDLGTVPAIQLALPLRLEAHARFTTYAAGANASSRTTPATINTTPTTPGNRAAPAANAEPASAIVARSRAGRT